MQIRVAKLIVLGCSLGSLLGVSSQSVVFSQQTVDVAKAIDQYAVVDLTTDLSQLTDKQRQMLPLLMEAGKIMDNCFWYEAYGPRKKFMESLEKSQVRRFVKINYGPWDRLDGNAPFVEGVGAKPLGANYYPADMTKAEFEAADLSGKDSLYTFLRRDKSGKLKVVPYREQFKQPMQRAADLLRQAAELAEDTGLRRYLMLRADALLTDDYQPSDLAWLDMHDNTIDVVIGPIENYEDKLYGYKTAHECFVLIKDKAWSARLAKYSKFLPDLQATLPRA